MNIIKHNDKVSDKGFIYVASLNKKYYYLAINSARTLKDYHPNAHITLYTHKDFYDKEAEIFDTVITDIPIHYRAKMWCMTNTPYDKTIYIDADSIIMHRDIRTMHNFLDDCDMFFCPTTSYTTGDIRWAYIDKQRTIPPKYHGAVVGFNKTPLTIDFVSTWFTEYINQVTQPWLYGKNHHQAWQIFDMFTLWRMTSKKFPEFDRFNELNIKLLPLRYNITAQHIPEDKDRPVIHQIDSGTIKKMEYFWGEIERKLKNELHTFEKRKITDPTYDFN